MGAFLDTITTLPTIVFTVLLGIVGLYWCLGLLGAVDIDILGGDADLDLDVDADLDMDVDADADMGGDAHAHGGGLLSVLGLSGVPLSLAVSLLVLFGWLISALASGWILHGVGSGLRLVVALAIGVGAFLLAIPPAALCVRPLRKLFATHQAERNSELIGRVCTITTQRVTATFGQAEVATGGAPHLVQVRCLRQNELTRGSTAVVSDYDAAEEVFHVAPADAVGRNV